MRACTSFLVFNLSIVVKSTFGFVTPSPSLNKSTQLASHETESDISDNSRRGILTSSILACSTFLLKPQPSFAAGSFTPGGTLVDREVGPTVGNPEASPTLKVNNENVLFSQDNYFKFGVAAPWIEPDTTEFPKTMPFVLSQQRYDALKKYGERVKSGAQVLKKLDDVIKAEGSAKVPGCDDPSYSLRPLGLLANGFLGSENTGTTNELLLARWYINEIYLRIGDIQNAPNEAEALKAHDAAQKAMNSYLSMMNRVITSKVGNKFEYII
jgi:hypothetical protein